MTEENSIHNLNKYIQHSFLSQEDKFIWTNGIGHLDEKTAKNILDYLEEFPENIHWATDILKRKVGVLKNNDTEAWSQILEEERIKLRELTNNEQ